MGKIIRCIKNKISAEQLFFIAFISRLVITTWDTTMFPSVGIVRKIALLLVLSCACAKILLFDSFSLDEIICIGITTICVGMQFITTGSNVLLVTLLLVIAAKNIDFKKILKVYILITGSIILYAFICSNLGVIKNLRYWVSEGGYYRNSFGIVYCTDFAAHVFFLLLAYFYIRGKNLRWFEYLITLIIDVGLFFSTRAKLDSICIALTVVLFALGNEITNHEGLKKVVYHYWTKTISCVSAFGMIIATMVMTLLTMFFFDDKGWMTKIDTMITHRLSVSQKVFKEYGVGLFGKNVTLVGNGGSEIINYEEYNFVDCSYLYVALLYGLVVLLIVLAAYTFMTYKNRRDIWFCYAVLMITLNSMISHHLTDIGYNCFIFGITAALAKERINNAQENMQC